MKIETETDQTMKNSKIDWCDHTFNAWIGCTKVSPGCEHCYAETWGRRFGVSWGPGKPRRRTSATYWRQPLIWNKRGEVCVECGTPITFDGTATDCKCGQAGALGNMRRPRVFCGSLMDWLDPEVPVEWLADLLDLIRRTPNLDWLLLTKRPELWRERMRSVCAYVAQDDVEATAKYHAEFLGWLLRWFHNDAPSNVWIGTTVEDQQRADERIPALLAIPAKVRFLSCEPLLGRVDICVHESLEAMAKRDSLVAVDWVISGCESGPHRRHTHPEWIYYLKDQCADAGVPFFLKQMFLEGRVEHNIDKFPRDLRIREFPNT